MRHTVRPYSITSPHDVDAPAEPALQRPRLLDEARCVVSTTMIYPHVLKVGGGGVQSPLDSLPALLAA